MHRNNFRLLYSLLMTKHKHKRNIARGVEKKKKVIMQENPVHVKKQRGDDQIN